MNGRIVIDVRRKLAETAHLSQKSLDGEVRMLLGALDEKERGRLRILALLIVRATQDKKTAD